MVFIVNLTNGWRIDNTDNLTNGLVREEEYVETYLCPTEEKSDISGPIRSIKMSSCVQCAMQRKSLCWRAMTCLAHMEQGPGPLHPGHPPPLPYLPGHWNLSLLVAFNKDGSGQCSGQPQTAQFGICVHRRVYVHIVLYFPSSNSVFWNVPPNGLSDCWYIFMFD
jgi:hypothetical protein